MRATIILFRQTFSFEKRQAPPQVRSSKLPVVYGCKYVGIQPANIKGEGNDGYSSGPEFLMGFSGPVLF